MVRSLLRVGFCRVLRVLLGIALLIFVCVCFFMFGKMDVLSRISACVIAILLGGLIVGLAYLIGRYCGKGGCVANLKRYTMCWMIAVISVLAVSIVAPTFGLTFHSHQSLIQTERDSDSGGGSIFDIDWD